VRGVDEVLVRALQERAGQHGHCAEAEHRAILIQALARPSRRGVVAVPASLPNVGADADFERVASSAADARVLD